MDKLLQLWQTTGIYHMAWGQAVMIVVCFGLIYLAIRKGFEPLLLIPIGFGGILANLPVANMAEGSGILHMIYEVGLPTSVFPLLIFMGVGAMTDFGPMLANPRTLLLGAAAQFGIFGTLLGALALTEKQFELIVGRTLADSALHQRDLVSGKRGGGNVGRRNECGVFSHAIFS